MACSIDWTTSEVASSDRDEYELRVQLDADPSKLWLQQFNMAAERREHEGRGVVHWRSVHLSGSTIEAKMQADAHKELRGELERIVEATNERVPQLEREAAEREQQRAEHEATQASVADTLTEIFRAPKPEEPE